MSAQVFVAGGREFKTARAAIAYCIRCGVRGKVYRFIRGGRTP